MPKDLFSGHADAYAKYRPAYPKAMFDFIFNQVNRFDLAWDCGTGNGQVASVVAERFNKVHATDISARQIANAVHRKNIIYEVSSAEKSPFADNTFDLITAGQAIHWFDQDKFYIECKRVAKPKAILACFGYKPVRCNSVIDKILDDFYFNVIYPYWETERKMVEDEYASLPFPFEMALDASFKIELIWTLHEFEGYINTWSAVQQYIHVHQTNPVDALINQVKPLWKEERLSVYFPVFLRLGRVN